MSSGSIQQQEEKKKSNSKRPPSVVFLKDGDKAKMVKVETGLSDHGFIEIKKGLKVGQEIISGSFQAINKLLQDGSIIKIDTVSSVSSMKK
jgi:HlyD family secretion protein